MKRSKQLGFSLIEIMVVVIIIGMLAVGVGANLFGQVDKAKVKQTMADFATIEQALKLYRLDNHRYPTNEQGLDALRTKPSIDPVPRQWQPGGYLESPPIDPWENAYIYVIPGEKGDFDIYSLGADGQRGGEGPDADIYNWDRFEKGGE